MAQPIKVFFSYSHQDEDLRVQLEKHLSALKWQFEITAWHDRHIDAGAEWANVIEEQLQTAHIILLLVSSDFLASKYCSEIELEQALRRHDQGEACVIPIILRPVKWQGTPFGKLQAYPKDGKAVTTWVNQDEAWG